jgi:cytochrome c oxidase assembly factor CtaG
MFMHRKRTFALAAVFLVVALVVPPVLVVLQTNNTIYKYIIPGTNPAQGSPTITITITPQERETYDMVIITAAIIEVIFIILFVITIYYGIRHTHPEH